MSFGRVAISHPSSLPMTLLSGERIVRVSADGLMCSLRWMNRCDEMKSARTTTALFIAIAHEFYEVGGIFRHLIIRQTGHEEFSVRFGAQAVVEHRKNAAIRRGAYQ